MNTTKNHTPGPWQVQRTITGEKYALEYTGSNGDGEKKYGTFVESQEYVLAGVSGTGKERTLANALLIAAAPDLLAACEHAANVFRAEIKDIDPRNELSRNDTPELAAAWHNLETMEKAITKSRTL